MISEDGFLEREVVTIDPGIEKWIPAYFQSPPASSPPLPSLPTPPTSSTALPELKDLALSPQKHEVIDPTGGGNAFLGGFSIALARGQPILEAAAWGSVAASFAIEQVGTPALTRRQEGLEGSAEKGELWNGVSVEDRLREFLKRCGLAAPDKEKGGMAGIAE
jgi:hypothetical protein